MARTIQTARHDHQALVEAPVANPATSLPTITSRLHTEFMEVKVHTAICDSCDKHNKQTLYRCIKCSLHICSLCWNKKSGDGTHVFGGGLCNVPDVNVDFVIENGDTGGREGNESEDRKHARRRVHVISDDEDDDVSVLKPAPTTKNPEAIEAREQQKKTLNVTMNNDHHEGQENDLPRLWPIVPARRLPVLRPAVPAADMSATESANQATQINPHIHGEESDPERQRIVRVCDHLGRQLISSQYAFAGDQETKHQARSLTQSSISNQQANHYAHLHAQPTTYRQRPGTDVDQQAARNQHAFANNQPTDRQAPCLPQRLIAPQQAVHFTPCQNPHAIFRPRPGVDVDLQAARNQLAFANPPRVDHQAPRSGQASVSQQQVFHPAQSSISYQHAMDEVTARRQQASRLNQQAQAYANAKQMEAGNQQALSSHQVARPAGNRDQVAAHNQQAFISNHQSSSAARYAEQMVAARDQQAYLSRQQADCPIPGPAQTLASHRHATNPLPFPTQAFLSQQHAALQASRQAEHRRATEDRLNRPSGDTQAREVCLPVPINY